MPSWLARILEAISGLLPSRPRPPRPTPEPPVPEPEPTPEPTPPPSPPVPPKPDPIPVPPAPDYPDDLEELVRLHDEARPGPSMLLINPLLCRAAQAVVDANERPSKVRLDHNAGGSPGVRIKQAGYRTHQWAENLAYVPAGTADAPKQVLQLWLNSSGHRKNLMSSWATEIGVARGPRGVWAAIYATPTAAGMLAADLAVDYFEGVGYHQGRESVGYCEISARSSHEE